MERGGMEGSGDRVPDTEVRRNENANFVASYVDRHTACRVRMEGDAGTREPAVNAGHRTCRQYRCGRLDRHLSPHRVRGAGGLYGS